jgi:hypothetical protein
MAIVPELLITYKMNVKFMCIKVSNTLCGQEIHCVTTNENMCSPIPLKPSGSFNLDIPKNGPLDFFKPGREYIMDIHEISPNK